MNDLGESNLRLSSSNGSRLCNVCKTITFDMLRHGFQHPLTYKQAVTSGRNCNFCRLMVCSFARLQVKANAYEVDSNYDAFIPLLQHSDSVIRNTLPWNATWTLGPVMESFEHPPENLCWHVLRNFSGLHGTFSEGCTIQVSAPEDSAYLLKEVIPTREIYEANCSRNNNLLYHWLHSCIAAHSSCRRSLSGISYDDDSGEPLPTRIIHIGALDGSKKPCIFNSKGERGLYMALSHRWGKAQKVKTEKNTLEVYQKSLPMDALPKTFKDAIEVTRRLGILYLWIDSLCIVQDDPLDWEREAAQMGSIFERACCTIAAIDAIDDATNHDQGLFIPRRSDPLAVRMSCRVDEESGDYPLPNDPVWEEISPRLPFSAASITNKDVVLRPRWKELWHTVTDTAWHDRAWVVQERILSRRIIYYTKRNIFWECQSLSNDEENRARETPPIRHCFALDIEKLASNRDHSRIDPSLFGNWWYQIQEYSSCQITKEEDKLAAFAGLCDRVECRLNRKVFAGVLLDDYGYNLLWRRQEKPLTPYRTFHAPSWSWLANNGVITYHEWNIAEQPQPQILNLELQIQPVCLQASDRGSCKAGVCGVLLFEAPANAAVAAEVLGERQLRSNEELIRIFGSALNHEPNPLPRMEPSGEISMTQPKLSLPEDTQILRQEDTDEVIGWILQDTEVENGERRGIICAMVSVWQASGIPKRENLPWAVRDFDYANEEILDFIALARCPRRSNMYRRIGRGHVTRRGWISTCTRSKFRIY